MRLDKNSLTMPYRRGLLMFVMGAGLIALAGRAYDLQVLHRDFLSYQGNARQQRVVDVPAYRGTITDRNGEPLAISTPVDSVWVNPGEFLQDSNAVRALAGKLELDPGVLRKKVASSKDREFLYIKRQLPPDLAGEVAALGLRGVSLQTEYRRYYPSAEVGAHVLGFTDIDDHGQEGIELAYDSWLAGKPGLKRVLRDRLGRTVADIESIRPAEPGRDLQLSIDRRLQYLAYRELKAAVLQQNAESGSLVMLDCNSGEVLAMVNQPAFNPHNRKDLLGENYRNRGATDVFEPGSTMKPFTIAAALENGYIRPDSKINTSPGYIKISNYTINDSQDRGVLDIEGILRYSSNVGATKIALGMPASDLWNVYDRFGFGHLTNSGFPGEVPGYLGHFEHWSAAEHATLSYGYGLSTTALQLAHAYSIIANGGYSYPVSFQLRREKPVATRVLSEKTVDQVRRMLVSAVNGDGTGRAARVPGYKIAGKTGTARKSIAGGYSESEYVALFVGMAPATRPELVTVVVINNPGKGKYYGSEIAAPVFASVMRDALRLLNVAPDDIRSLYVGGGSNPGDRT
ncbi:MAG TPA: penicillin-binding transpeptidase domain-containing protein [Gammaproteobacteria bacterium]|nr:penicillin-binding transpeptidase domain-containing protein [Gammaproteobacteria bacterium]